MAGSHAPSVPTSEPTPRLLLSDIEIRVREKELEISELMRLLKSSDSSLIANPITRRKYRDLLVPLIVSGLLLELPTWRSFCTLADHGIAEKFPMRCIKGGPFTPSTTYNLRWLCYHGFLPLFYQSRAVYTDPKDWVLGDPLAGSSSSTRGVIEFLWPSTCTVCASSPLSRNDGAQCPHTRPLLDRLLNALKQREEVRFYVHWYFRLAHPNDPYPVSGNWPPQCLTHCCSCCPPVPWYADQLRKMPDGRWKQDHWRGSTLPLGSICPSPVLVAADPIRVILMNLKMPISMKQYPETTDVLMILLEEVTKIGMPTTNQMPHAYYQHSDGSLWDECSRSDPSVQQTPSSELASSNEQGPDFQQFPHLPQQDHLVHLLSSANRSFLQHRTFQSIDSVLATAFATATASPIIPTGLEDEYVGDSAGQASSAGQPAPLIGYQPFPSQPYLPGQPIFVNNPNEPGRIVPASQVHPFDGATLVDVRGPALGKESDQSTAQQDHFDQSTQTDIKDENQSGQSTPRARSPNIDADVEMEDNDSGQASSSS